VGRRPWPEARSQTAGRPEGGAGQRLDGRNKLLCEWLVDPSHGSYPHLLLLRLCDPMETHVHGLMAPPTGGFTGTKK
jgi:hypothetical protein